MRRSVLTNRNSIFLTIKKQTCDAQSANNRILSTLMCQNKPLAKAVADLEIITSQSLHWAGANVKPCSLLTFHLWSCCCASTFLLPYPGLPEALHRLSSAFRFTGDAYSTTGQHKMTVVYKQGFFSCLEMTKVT